MKVLSFTLTEELLAAGESCAIASPAKLKDATARARMQILEIVVSLFFITFPVDARRRTPTIKNRKFASFWTWEIPISASGISLPTPANCGTKAGLWTDQVWETFCS